MYLREIGRDFRRTAEPVYLFEKHAWVRDQEGTARRVTVTEPYLGLFMHLHKERSSLRVPLLTALSQDKDIGPALGKMVGDEGHLTRFDADSVISHAAGGIARSNGSVSVVKADISKRLRQVRRYLTETVSSNKVIIPLPGLKSHSFPLQIDEAIQIDRLTEDEINAAVGAGVLRPLSEEVPILDADECVGVRVRIESRRVQIDPQELEATKDVRLRELQEQSARPHRFGQVSRLEIADVMGDVLFVLRLARPEFVGTLGAVMISNGLSARSLTVASRPTRGHMRTSYEIEIATARQLRRFWKELKAQAGQRRSLPPICQRRFNAAIDRVSLDDAIIDYLIAAEALYLKDAGSPDNRGELGYRLALRAGTFLEKAPDERLALLRFMKQAYDARSRISHGGTSPSSVKVPGREAEVSLREFVEEINLVLRRSLRKAIRLYVTNPSFGDTNYWDSLLLRG